MKLSIDLLTDALISLTDTALPSSTRYLLKRFFWISVGLPEKSRVLLTRSFAFLRLDSSLPVVVKSFAKNSWTLAISAWINFLEVSMNFWKVLRSSSKERTTLL